MFKLNVTPRNSTAQSNYSLRKQGLIPAVYFHKGEASEPLTVTLKDLNRALSSHDPIIQLSNNKMAIIKEVQLHTVTSKIVHVSMQGVVAGEKFHKEIPVQCTHDENAGWVKAGMILMHMMKTVTIETTPENVPEALIVDVSALEKGDVFRVKDLTLPKGVKVMDDPEDQIAHVGYPHVETESAPTAAAEPEVVGKETATAEKNAAPAATTKDKK